MKQFLVVTLLLLSGLYVQAQRPSYGGAGSGPSITGNISGTLIDSTTNEPIEFATVVLVDEKTKKQVDGGLTDENGDFKLTEIKLGTYSLTFSFMGYESKTVTGVELTKSKPDYKVSDVVMQATGVTLAEVEVVEEASVIENQIDKLVYNADKDVTSIGGDASDILRKVPLLSVDLDGNVSLRGSQNVRILINGKPSTIFAANPGEALQNIPSDQIKSVEVITTPTARYEGEGSAGIINIITKKKSIDGFTGSVSTAVGNTNSRANANLNFAKGRFGLNANVGGWYSWPLDNPNFFIRENVVNGQLSTLRQEGNSRGSRLGPRGSIGGFYDFNAYNSINSSVSFFGRGGNSDNTINARNINPILGLDQTYERISETNSLRGGFDWTTDYTKKFKNPDQEFILAFQLSGSTNQNEATIFQEDLNGNDETLFRDERNDNDGLNLEYTFQADYVHPFSPKVKMETGFKGIIREIDSDYRYEERLASDEPFTVDPNRTDKFFYDQDVYAGYLSFNVKLGDKWGMVAGARYEKTEIGGEFETFENSFSNEYENFLPSIIVNRKLSEASSIKASYARRIQRPSLRFINPYIEVEDSRNISFGFPEVDPELTDQYEVSYNTFIKGLVINVSVFYRRTTSIIENFLDVALLDENGNLSTNYQQAPFAENLVRDYLDDSGEREVSFTTYRNIAENNSVGFSVFGSKSFFNRKLSVRGGFNLFTYDAEGSIGDLELSNQGVQWDANGNITLSLPNDFKVEASGFFRSPRQSLQGARTSFIYYSIGANKQVTKRFSLGLSVVSPFSKFLNFENELTGENFYQFSRRSIQFRSFRLNVSYKFGKLNFKQPRRRRSNINNDDQKGGGGNEGFQG